MVDLADDPAFVPALVDPPVDLPADPPIDPPIDPPAFDHVPPFLGPDFRLPLAPEASNSDDSDSEDSRPRRRRRRHNARRTPVLDEAHRPLVAALLADITQEIAGRDRFAGFMPPDLLRAAETLVRYRLSTLEIIRHTERDARRLFLAECQHSEQQSFPELQLLSGINTFPRVSFL